MMKANGLLFPYVKETDKALGSSLGEVIEQKVVLDTFLDLTLQKFLETKIPGKKDII
jgi:hypothetical protein